MESITSAQEQSASIPANLAHIQELRTKNNAMSEAFKEQTAELKSNFEENKAEANTKVSLSLQSLADRAQQALDKEAIEKSIIDETANTLEVFDAVEEKIQEQKYEKELEEFEEAERKAKKAEQQALIENLGSGNSNVTTNADELDTDEPKAPQEPKQASSASNAPKAAPTQTAAPTTSMKMTINVPSTPPQTPSIDLQV